LNTDADKSVERNAKKDRGGWKTKQAELMRKTRREQVTETPASRKKRVRAAKVGGRCGERCGSTRSNLSSWRSERKKTRTWISRLGLRVEAKDVTDPSSRIG
jgi:hypothetical protein